jgi:DegV family protein with EDD domain
MKIKIVADSSCDLNKEIKNQYDIHLVPLTLELGDKKYIDDETLDVKQYLKDMSACETAPKSACPAPQEFMRNFEGDESVFVVTMSSQISGTYNSALIAKNIFLEDIENKFIHVFNSLSASVGETLVCLKIAEFAKLNFSELEIVDKVNKYISELKTFFLLENFDHLVKSGRLNPILAKIATMLSIKPIMGASEEGTIKLFDKVRGYKKAFSRFIDMIEENGTNLESKILGIAHCNCMQRAVELKEEILKRYNFKDIIIVEMSGLISSYADEGGLIIAF